MIGARVTGRRRGLRAQAVQSFQTVFFAQHAGMKFVQPILVLLVIAASALSAAPANPKP
ncbi:MAG: hypothetical protein JWQ62_2778, partial [Lacunisphaera sp.]|nr:hypothetical protein [Lacunisphaera sp.]